MTQALTLTLTQGVLFIAVIFGLGLGHALFNVNAPVSESA